MICRAALKLATAVTTSHQVTVWMPVGSAVSDAHTDLIGSAGSRMTCCSDHSVSWPSMGLMTVGKV